MPSSEMVHCVAQCVLWLLVTANIPSSLILVTLMMEMIRSSETSVLERATRHNISEDGILYITFVLQVVIVSNAKYFVTERYITLFTGTCHWSLS
jgi:hypothetical protein